MKRALLAIIVAIIIFPPPATTAAEDGPPPFPSITLSSLDGSTNAEISSFRGRPVLLTFWASWCAPCRTELPELEKLYAELMPKGFVLLTVNVDQSPAAAVRFMQSTGLTLPVYRADPMDLRRLGINSLPTNILLDGEGRAAQVFSGYSAGVPQEVRRLVNEMHEEKMQRLQQVIR